jgi:hypothetical protein
MEVVGFEKSKLQKGEKVKLYFKEGCGKAPLEGLYEDSLLYEFPPVKGKHYKEKHYKDTIYLRIPKEHWEKGIIVKIDTENLSKVERMAQTN